jgi:hypothetical protein
MKVSFRLYGCDSKVRLHLDSVGTKKKKKNGIIMFLVCNLLKHACICNIIKNEFPWVHSNLEIKHNSSPLGRPLP